MKATKIMGAVLGVLLVAALFTGAAAAADEKNLGDVYAYKLYDNTFAVDLSKNATWTDAAGNTVTFIKDVSNKYYINGIDAALEGVYTRGIGELTYKITVKNPTAEISGIVYKDENATEAISQLVGGVAENDKFVTLSAADGAKVAITNPAGTLTSVNFEAFDAVLKNQSEKTYEIEGIDLGVWTAQAYYTNDGINFSVLAPAVMLGKPYHFTVVSSEDSKKLVANVEEVVQGGFASYTLTAPTGNYNLTVSHGEFPVDQPNFIWYKADKTEAAVKVPAAGSITFSVKATDTSDVKVTLKKMGTSGLIDDKSASVTVISGTITAAAETDSVYIGNEFDIEGTNDLGGAVKFFVKGTNFDLTELTQYSASGKEWDVTIKTEDLRKKANGQPTQKRPDAGTYTFYIAKMKIDGSVSEVKDFDNTSKVYAYTTVSVALKQPFINLIDAPEVLVQGDELKVKGTAEGEPSSVQWYLFGTNYFNNDTVAVTDGEFTVKVEKEFTKSDYMAAGQYFLVVQHPMYDKVFNIGVVGKNIVLNESGAVTTGSSVIFSTDERQSANAAEALCRALDSQNIDDMYQKVSFVVAGPTSYIDAIPSQVTKGQVLTVSGTTTGHKDEVVTVELLSTAFAAIPKEAVGSASFVALTTKIGADGVWSISFDTSSLNADEYTCSVAVGQLDATTSKVTIVEGSTPVTPTQTTTPVTPTAQPTAQPTQTPATPGFGALAALAGLGAVAVLLLRRQ